MTESLFLVNKHFTNIFFTFFAGFVDSAPERRAASDRQQEVWNFSPG
jgi:hypothetical protein